MEPVGSNPTCIFGTVHTLRSGGPGAGAAVQVSDACTAFRDDPMTWTPDEIQFDVDGFNGHRCADPRTGSDPWPFDAPQYRVLNIAIGGTLGGAVDDRIVPVSLEVDHVRVWRLVRWQADVPLPACLSAGRAFRLRMSGRFSHRRG